MTLFLKPCMHVQEPVSDLVESRYTDASHRLHISKGCTLSVLYVCITCHSGTCIFSFRIVEHDLIHLSLRSALTW